MVKIDENQKRNVIGSRGFYLSERLVSIIGYELGCNCC